MNIEKVKHKRTQPEPSKIWGRFSLWLGITSIILFLMPYFGLPMAILAIICNSMQKKYISTGAGTAGLVLGIIGIIINIMMIFCVVVYIMLVGL